MPRNRRRKDARPQEITAAAFDAFAENGYARTKVQDVARRAGISKGLMYLYFKTKEELFKAVIRGVVAPRVDTLQALVESSEMSSREFLRGPVAELLKTIPNSRVAVVMRLLLSEGPRHPDLLDYYWEQVVSKAMAAITLLLERGVERGEFRRTALNDLPQLVAAPMLVATIWGLLFPRRGLDTGQLVDTQIDMIIGFLENHDGAST